MTSFAELLVKPIQNVQAAPAPAPAAPVAAPAAAPAVTTPVVNQTYTQNTNTQYSQPQTYNNTTSATFSSSLTSSTNVSSGSAFVNEKDDKDEKKVKEEKKFTREEVEAEYNEITEDLNAAGIQTTQLADAEANFGDYGAALSDELKQEIIDSFDTEADYQMQSALAGLYTNKSVMNTDQFIAAAREMGYDVELNYVGTSYIADNKADGHYDKDVINGAIGVLTIKDPATGGEIKIADANGNGAIESEELFMNEILEGVSANIDTSQFTKAVAAGTAAGTISENSEVAKAIGKDNYDKIVSEYEGKEEEIKEEIDRAKEAEIRHKEQDEEKEKQGLKKISATRYSELVKEMMEKYYDDKLGEDATEEEKDALAREAAEYANKQVGKKYTV